MAPTLLPGDRVYADPAQAALLAEGDLVICAHPFRDLTLVKRVARKSASGRLDVRGDNPDSLASQDSRGFGLLRGARGRVVLVRRLLSGGASPSRLLARAPEGLARASGESSCRLAGAPDRFGCEAHLELARAPEGVYLTLSAAALPWLSEAWCLEGLRRA